MAKRKKSGSNPVVVTTAGKPDQATPAAQTALLSPSRVDRRVAGELIVADAISPALSALPAPSAPPAPWEVMLGGLRQRVLETRSDARHRRHTPTTPTVYYLLELAQQEHTSPTLRIFIDEEDNRSGSDLPWWEECEPADSEDLEDSLRELSSTDQLLIDRILDLGPADDPFMAGWTPALRRKLSHSFYDQPSGVDFLLEGPDAEWLLRNLTWTGRLYWRVDAETQPRPVRVKHWAAEPLRPRLILSDTADGQIRLSLDLVSDNATHSLAEVAWMWGEGIVLLTDRIAPLATDDSPWVLHFLQGGEQIVAPDQLPGLLHSLLDIPNLLPLVWPESWSLREEVGAPTPVLKLMWPKRPPAAGTPIVLLGTVTFRYADRDLVPHDSTERLYDADQHRIVIRDRAREAQHCGELFQSGEIEPSANADIALPLDRMAGLPQALAAIGWTVEAEGRPLAMPGEFFLEVNSDMDWFELRGGAKYANQIVPVPVLLQALRRKENFVRLDDGSHGLLPTQWIEKFGKLLELADTDGDVVRFGRAQAMLLDALLTEQDKRSEVVVDAAFQKLRRELTRFQGITEVQAPASFKGKLRRYQRESLGWFQFLQRFGFGGCLADDMGLGKTVQVLALLEQRRARRLKKGEVRKPSLVVVPKSLVFNWRDEASRFAPRLRIVDFTGLARHEREHELESADVILTTYGTLRREIERLSAMEFDYAILDEAQAIKNPQTDAAKACYVLRADHRLAMTGTPIENHLGDLWSQFRFLNPGLLGKKEMFAGFYRGDGDPEALQRLAAVVRPFLLRRTKQQVLKELPKKTEQTLLCEMNPTQARQYSELREHFRLKLQKTVKELGIRRSAIHVLDALLRLRQAACDGRLINPKQGARGVKLDMLLDQLEEVTREGHKVLVFSQFTKLLGLLQTDLRKRKLTFEYLDGKTGNRKACVDRFQKDSKCSLFLISLKAGGHGLNLTAADYVYILDPWWNPAVEAQAVDRAHRMGQRKQVFAYRMITKGTVEEKIMELQKSKRDLAESIISGNNSLIQNLTADDLQLLLSR